MKSTIAVSVIAAALMTVSACRDTTQDTSTTVQQTPSSSDPEVQRLEAMSRRFAPVDLTAPTAALPEHERRALAKIIEAAQMFDALVPLGRHTTPEEITHAVLYLAADESAMMTAHTFAIDGGLSG